MRRDSPSVLLGAPVRSRAGGRRLVAVAAVVGLCSAALAVVAVVTPHAPDRHVHGLLVIVALTLLFILVAALLRVLRHEVRHTTVSRGRRVGGATSRAGGVTGGVTGAGGGGTAVDGSTDDSGSVVDDSAP